MAAPKKWGYSREQPIGPEMLVSWADGDLTDILVRELEERLLTHPEERRDVAAFARASYDSSTFDGKDRLLEVRSGLVEACKGIVGR